MLVVGQVEVLVVVPLRCQEEVSLVIVVAFCPAAVAVYPAFDAFVSEAIVQNLCWSPVDWITFGRPCWEWVFHTAHFRALPLGFESNSFLWRGELLGEVELAFFLPSGWCPLPLTLGWLRRK